MAANAAPSPSPSLPGRGAAESPLPGREGLGEGSERSEPLALYVHWPFCVTKCPYCDFNSHVRESVDQDAWAKALLADLAFEAARLPGRRLASIFFGGGTPSLMPPATVAAVIEAACRHWTPEPNLEITLEANPSSVEAGRFAGFASAGVNRLSLGVQALDDAALKLLGRPHDVAAALAALDVAQATFNRVSFDLIYDRPGMTRESWQAELSRALGFGTTHLSLYQLTIEPGTRFAALHARGQLVMPDEDTSADLFAITQSVTMAAGIPAYEISNHAAPGLESRHNLTYWRYGDYAGIGPGAHGRRLAQATLRRKKPEHWLAGVTETGHGMESETPLTVPERTTEALVMGLRLAEGLDAARFAARSGTALADAVKPDAVARLVTQGLLISDARGLRLTPAGWPLANAVLAEIAR